MRLLLADLSESRYHNIINLASLILNLRPLGPPERMRGE